MKAFPSVAAIMNALSKVEKLEAINFALIRVFDFAVGLYKKYKNQRSGYGGKILMIL